MNSRQRVVLVLAALIVLVMGIYPSFHIRFPNGFVVNLGYAPIFDPPKYESPRQSYAGSVNIQLLMTQWFGVAVVAGVLIFLTKTNYLLSAMDRINPGSLLDIRLHPRWQFWDNNTALAEVIDIDRYILHLSVTSVAPNRTGLFQIAHLPISSHQIFPHIIQVGLPTKKPAYANDFCKSALELWRKEHAEGRAGSFNVSLLKAIRMIYLRGMMFAPDREFVKSAYPVRGKDGQFDTVHVIPALYSDL